MDKFVSRIKSQITGVVSGFDRLVFRGTLIPLVRKRGMHHWLSRVGVRLLDFKDYALHTSDRVKDAALADAREGGQPTLYLQHGSTNKEDLALRLAKEHPIDEGLICTLSAIETCMSFEYHRSPRPEERGLKLRPRKCLHIYKYFQHPLFGFMNARLQTWFPFSIQICLNGREWLGKLMVGLAKPARQHRSQSPENASLCPNIERSSISRRPVCGKARYNPTNPSQCRLVN